MKEKVLNALGNLGFKLNEETENGYHFCYEGVNMLYIYNEDDEDFLNIAVPGVVEIEEDKIFHIFALLEKINSSLKYVKAYILGNSLWLFYERELFGEEDLMNLISRMIVHLEAGIIFTRRKMAEIEANNTDDAADEVVIDGAEEFEEAEITDTEDE